MATALASFDRRLSAVRDSRLGGPWFFAYVFAAQLGHLIEHIAKALTGSGLFGNAADMESSHLAFNSIIAVLSLLLVVMYPRNPWVYPLLVLALLHGIEHVYIYSQFIRFGIVNGPGIFGIGGALGVIPLGRLDLHNVYNGFEMILMVLGLGLQIEERLEERR